MVSGNGKGFKIQKRIVGRNLAHGPARTEETGLPAWSNSNRGLARNSRRPGLDGPKGHWVGPVRRGADALWRAIARTAAICATGSEPPAANRRARPHRKVHRGWEHPSGNLGWTTSQRKGAATERTVITGARRPAARFKVAPVGTWRGGKVRIWRGNTRTGVGSTWHKGSPRGWVRRRRGAPASGRLH
jgi:hypothetical protein